MISDTENISVSKNITFIWSFEHILKISFLAFLFCLKLCSKKCCQIDYSSLMRRYVGQPGKVLCACMMCGAHVQNGPKLMVTFYALCEAKV